MKRLLLVVLLSLGLASGVSAQTQVTIGSSTATMSGCPSGSFLDGTIVSGTFHCSAATAGGSVVVGCGLVGAGTTANPLAINIGLKTLTVARAIVAGDNCQTYRYALGTSGNFPLPLAGSVGFVWPFAFCVTVVSGTVNFTGQTIEGGPTSYGRNQNVCLGVNDQTPANWTVFDWTALATPNSAPLP